MPTASEPAHKLRTEVAFKSSANWFFWIAGLSLVNSVIHLSGSNMSFVIGLGTAQIIDVVARQMGSAGQVFGFGLAVAIAGVFIGFGALCRGRHAFAFYVGGVLYALDGLLFLIVKDWLSLAFHAFALVMIARGPSALRKLNELELATAAGSASTAATATAAASAAAAATASATATRAASPATGTTPQLTSANQTAAPASAPADPRFAPPKRDPADLVGASR